MASQTSTAAAARKRPSKNCKETLSYSTYCRHQQTRNCGPKEPENASSSDSSDESRPDGDIDDCYGMEDTSNGFQEGENTECGSSDTESADLAGKRVMMMTMMIMMMVLLLVISQT